MTRGLFLDPASGIAGDMFLASLIDLGLSIEDLRRGLESLSAGEFRLETKTVHRGALRALKFDVIVKTHDDGVERIEGLGEDHQSHAHHDHGQGQSGHHHGEHAHGLGYRDIRTLIEESEFSSATKDRAQRIFACLAQAEGRVHGHAPEDVHFHEVGAVDSIVDICGAALAIELLDIDEVVSSSVSVGEGRTRMAHGHLPIPVPATAEILRGMPLVRSGVQRELVTPTGAAILKVLVEEFSPRFEYSVLGVGYGAGSTDRGDPPNVLRTTLYEREATISGLAAVDRVTVLETQVDDMTGEALGFLRSRLEEEGALDVLVQPVQMKKDRPGQLITVVLKPDDRDRLEEVLFSESSTFGIRVRQVDRVVLTREILPIPTPWGELRLKVGSRGGRILQVEAEYEDAARVAREKGLPFRQVASRIVAWGREALDAAAQANSIKQDER
ncbi:MAG: nickel pincer cofactor biosynthesis protein LarC [Planctomycetota bacterium]